MFFYILTEVSLTEIVTKERDLRASASTPPPPGANILL